MGCFKSWLLAALRIGSATQPIFDPLTCKVSGLSAFCSTSSSSLRLEDEKIINNHHYHYPGCLHHTHYIPFTALPPPEHDSTAFSKFEKSFWEAVLKDDTLR